jgi:4a-hydroxytetrahydrobiopterin dehydratase
MRIDVTPLSLDALTIQALAPWSLVNQQLQRTDTFGSFNKAMDWVNAIARLANRYDHHPNIDIRYKCVTLSLWSHDVGGLTTRDTQLAMAINALLKQV